MSYTCECGEALERLETEERHDVYRMIRLRVAYRPDGALEASGILSERLGVGYENGRAVCRSKLASWRTPRAANRAGLAFRALLAEGDAKIFELTKA
jgi:hypothetical protein